MIGIGGRELVEEAECGYAVGGNDYRELAAIIREKILPDKDSFARKGENGRAYYLNYFTKEKCMNHLESLLINIKDYFGNGL